MLYDYSTMMPLGSILGRDRSDGRAHSVDASNFDPI